MNKQILCILVAIAIATAAAPEKKEFTIGSFFEGSWVIASRKVNLDSGDIVSDVSFSRYNITKTDENEYDIFPLENNSYLRDRNADQVVLFTSSLACEVKKYNVDTDSFDSVGEFTFTSMLPNESYVCEMQICYYQMSTGMSPFNNKEEYEITTFADNHFTIKFINRAEKIVTIYTATRVIIPPPLTFMQKYGMSLLMAAMIIVQVTIMNCCNNRWLQSPFSEQDLFLQKSQKLINLYIIYFIDY